MTLLQLYGLVHAAGGILTLYGFLWKKGNRDALAWLLAFVIWPIAFVCAAWATAKEEQRRKALERQRKADWFRK